TTITTDANGDMAQSIQYTAFGEVFIEERYNNTWKTPFLFNAKELDEETGLYYYGARYYDPHTSLWLSVDPLAIYNPFEKENYIDGQHRGGIFNSFNHAVYGYCMQNPVKYVDPNGKQSSSLDYGQGFNVSQRDIQAAYNYQKTGWIGDTMGDKIGDALYKMTPAAIVLSISGKAGAVLFGEGKVSLGMILKGNNKGFHGYATGSTGAELDVEVSGGLSVDAVYPERVSQFTGEDLEGKSTETFFEFAVKRILNKAASINVNLSKGESQSKKVGDIDIYGAGVSAGFSVSGAIKGTIGKILDVFNIGRQENHTKGFKTNSYKPDGKK
ncbi:RHS repeat-associated protein, partial [Dysgonomonas sp. PH5-45]|uniref:RHS repeat-associated core domain-containing protein n=1 Tax=unclassified Dysgonomonas TaxID=2630389 RepID=UPI00247400ED